MVPGRASQGFAQGTHGRESRLHRKAEGKGESGSPSPTSAPYPQPHNLAGQAGNQVIWSSLVRVKTNIPVGVLPLSHLMAQ